MSFLTPNVGTDLSLTIVNSQDGSSITLDGRRTSFECSAKDQLLESEPIDNGGRVDHVVIPKGWTGTIECDRNGDNFSALVAFLDANYYAGGSQQYFSIQSVEPGRNGQAVNRYQHTGVVFHGYKPGAWTKSAIVKARFEFACQERIKLS